MVLDAIDVDAKSLRDEDAGFKSNGATREVVSFVSITGHVNTKHGNNFIVNVD